jgi:succinate dehydrogenase / fumarate reductase, flavoprotein subunit
VFLDVSHRDKDFILAKLPRMYRQFIEYQMLDISQEPMEVAPTAHYSMGGAVVDPETHATDVEGLYAAGEVTAGLHGANRLGGNSLAETMVFGRRAGAAVAAFSRDRHAQLRSPPVLREAMDDLDGLMHEGTEIVRPVQRALRNAMWECCGVVRSEEGLQRGLAMVNEIKELFGSIDVRPTSEGYGDLAHVLDLRASLVTAETSLRGALERRETRGSHNRSDCPAVDPDLRVNLQTNLDSNGRLQISREPVPPVAAHLRDWARDTGEYEMTSRLLE